MMRMGVVALVCFQVLGWLQNLHPAFDSFSHFRLHFATIMVPVALVFLLVRRWQWVSVCGVTCAISIGLSAPYLPGFKRGYAVAGKVTEKPQLSIVQMNVRFNNKAVDLAAKILKDADADIYLLQEITRTNEAVLAKLRPTHPHQISCQGDSVGSVAIVSRFRFGPTNMQKCARFYGYAQAALVFGGRQIMVANLHSRWPWPAGQQKQITRMMPNLKALPSPLILAGDFNSAPWSAVVKRVARATNTSSVAGLALSWAPRFLEFKATIGPVLPIDQVLHSKNLGVVSREVLQDGGSDHFPIQTRFVVLD